MGDVWATAVATPGYQEDPQPQTFVLLIAHVLPYGLHDEKSLPFQLTAASCLSLEKESWVNKLGWKNVIDSSFWKFNTLLNVINLTGASPFASLNQINGQKIQPSFVSQHTATDMCNQMNTSPFDG